MTDTTVLVVGAGPTGLLLAAELLRRGARCLIIDAQPEPSIWDRATIVHPRSLEVFAALGIVDEFLRQGVKQHFARLHSANEVLGEIDLSLCGSPFTFNIGISEEVTESILSKYLERHGGHVDRGSQLIRLEQQGDRVRATVLQNGVERVVSASWVVGCDGYRSSVRQQCGVELIGNDSDDPWAVFDTTLVGWHDSHEAIYGYLDTIPVILTSLPHERWRVYLRPSSPESDLVADAETTLRQYFPALAFADVANPTRFRCHSKVANHFRAGRALLAGDAAHVCSPSQGHGMNSGLQDAFNLAWKLALVCTGHCSPDLLNSYEAERRPVAEKNAASGEEFERAQDMTDPAARRDRDRTLKAVFADPQTSHRESTSEAELDFDYAASPIVLGDPHPTIGPGHRLPTSIRVTHADGTQRGLHELAHRAGHTALLLGGAGASHDQLAGIAKALAACAGQPQIEATIAMTAADNPRHSLSRITPDVAEQMGVRKITLLVVRPDGHIGLRADQNHVEAVTTYCSLLSSGGTKRFS